MIKPPLLDFLPENIFDIHVHVFDDATARLGPKDFRRKFNGRFAAADYFELVNRHLPGHRCSINTFGMPERDADCAAADRFTGQGVDLERVFGFALVRPEEPPTELEARMRQNRLVGLKPYPDLVPGKTPADVELADLLAPGQLALADRHGWPVMLHLPRRLRLTDPLNQSQLENWLKSYPNVKFIVAHLGRSYFFKGIEGQLARFAIYDNLFFDTAMINHDRVLEYAFRNFPRARLLFGSDAPIAFLYGKALEINDQYLYLMAEDYAIGTCLDGRGAPVEFTTFFAEQLAACRTAALAAKLTDAEIENFFYHNSNRLIREAAQWLR
jgi:predicted TIM-barrel fold metal-dependent hydrolase